MKRINITGGALDVLYRLSKGPAEDGDLPSKSGFGALVHVGLARKDYGSHLPNVLTEQGHIQAYLNMNDLPFTHTTTIDLLKRPRNFRMILEKLVKERMICCEYGNYRDQHNLWENLLSEVRTGKTQAELEGEDAYGSLGRMRRTVEDRVCAKLVNPQWTDTTVTFDIIPTGPFGEILKEQLDQGDKFYPGARMFLLGHGISAVCREILALDLLHENHYIDTGVSVTPLTGYEKGRIDATKL